MPIIYEPAGKAREYSPLAANLYKGCGHGCTYCYAPAALRMSHRREEFYGCPKPRSDVLAQLRSDADKAQERGERREILLSFTSDPYQPLDVETQLTRKALRILTDRHLTVTVLTKGGTRACRDFDFLAKGPRNAFATTLTCLDAEESRRWEPGAATPADRIEAIRRAKAAGITTWVSLEPVLDPDTVYRLIDATLGLVDLYKVGKLNYHPRAKEIDWPAFRERVTAQLTGAGVAHYVKEDLRTAA